MWLLSKNNVLLNASQCAATEMVLDEDNIGRYCITATTFDGREYWLVENGEEKHAQATFNDMADIVKAEVT